MLRKRLKKGLSTIVSTLLILLLVFVAIGILWVVVRNVIQSGSEQVSLGKFTLDLAIDQVQVSGNQIIVKVERKPGAGEFTGIKFIISDDKNTETFDSNITLYEDEKKSFTFTPTIVDVSNLQKIEIAPIFTLSSGKTSLGDIKATWEKEKETSSGGVTVVIPDNSNSNIGTNCTSNLNCTGIASSSNYCSTDNTKVLRNDFSYFCNTSFMCQSSTTVTTVQTCPTGYLCSSGICVQQTPTTISNAKIIGVWANASADADHLPTKTLDRVLSNLSYWAAEGDGQWITYELNQSTTVSYVKIAFYYSTQRYFDIQYSTNNITWINTSKVGVTSAANMANVYQTFSFTPINAKYIRYVGHGSSSPSLWNSIVEMDINGFPVALSSTACVPESSSVTCSGKCGTQVNNCGTSVDCGACGGGDGSIGVIFYNNFEQNTVGSSSYKSDWDYCLANSDARVYQNPSDNVNPSKVFRGFFPKGSWSLGNYANLGYDTGFKCEYYFKNKYDEAYFSYRVKFDNEFYPSKGGKLPRIEGGHESGGAANTCPDGTWFTGGMMFRNTGGLPTPVFYIYHIDQWNSTFWRNAYYDYAGTYPTSCDDFNGVYGVSGGSFYWTNPGYSCKWNDDSCRSSYSVVGLNRGVWYTITERVVVNTPGQKDGFVEGYIDGKMVSQIKGFEFRSTYDTGLDWIDFVGFFGGDDPSWAVQNDSYAYYDDLFVYYYTPESGQPIGHTYRSLSETLPSVNYPSTSVFN